MSEENNLIEKDYWKDIFGKKEGEICKDEVMCALKRAEGIRKFEIELLWKRTTYFWGFQAVVFSGLAVLTSAGDLTNADALKNAGENFKELLLFTMIFVGLITAIGWVFVNRGSKYWQENWEKHVDALEQHCDIPELYSTIFEDDKPIYSVTKINSIVSGTFVSLWLLLLFYFLHPKIKNMFSNIENNDMYEIVISIVIILISVVIILIPVIAMFRCGKSNLESKKITKPPFPKKNHPGASPGGFEPPTT